MNSTTILKIVLIVLMGANVFSLVYPYTKQPTETEQEPAPKPIIQKGTVIASKNGCELYLLEDSQGTQILWSVCDSLKTSSVSTVPMLIK